LYSEHGEWIMNGVHLHELLGQSVVSHERFTVTPDTTDVEMRRQALNLSGDFVAVVEPDETFARLINRRELADLVAKEVARSS
jgi:hypothetical protein